MKPNYELSFEAEHDIDDIITFIARENQHAAHDFVDALYDSFELLAEHPHLGHVREDLTAHTVRFWTFKWHYLVIYRPTTPLQIVRVLSGFRDLAGLI